MKNNEEIYEGQGYWWIPGQEDKRIPGLLSFSLDRGARLRLIGTLLPFGDSRALPLIHGLE